MALCRWCRAKKAFRGHPLAGKHPTWRQIKPLHRLVIRWLKVNPVPPAVLYRLERFVIGPEAAYELHRTPEDIRPTNLRKAKLALRALMGWWRDPNSEAKYSARNLSQLTKGAPTPEAVIAVLLACEVYIQEHDWAIGSAPEVFKAVQLLRLRKLRHKNSPPISGNVRRVLGMVINQAVGVHLIQSARAVIEWEQQTRTIHTASATPAKAAILRSRTLPDPPPIPRYPMPLPWRGGRPVSSAIAAKEAWAANERAWRSWEDECHRLKYPKAPAAKPAPLTNYPTQ